MPPFPDQEADRHDSFDVPCNARAVCAGVGAGIGDGTTGTTGACERRVVVLGACRTVRSIIIGIVDRIDAEG